jgi:hypothetical protein
MRDRIKNHQSQILHPATMTPLPKKPATYLCQPDSIFCCATDLISAYNLILSAEEAAVTKKDEDNILNARVVGYFLLECYKRAPQAASQISKEVRSPHYLPNTDHKDVVYGVGSVYRHFLLRVCEPLFLLHVQQTHHLSVSQDDNHYSPNSGFACVSPIHEQAGRAYTQRPSSDRYKLRVNQREGKPFLYFLRPFKNK